MQTDADVIVVGAGPAGAAMAVLLAERGHEVLVLDRAATPVDKVCGEGLLPHGVDALARLFPGALACGHPFRGISYTHGATRVVAEFEGRVGLGVQRAALATALRDRLDATRSVTLRRGVRARSFRVERGLARLETDAGWLTTRAVVAADGLGSTLAKRAGLARPPARFGQRFGVRRTFALPCASLVPEYVEVIASPGEELYVTPVGPTVVNVALLCGKESLGNVPLAERFDASIERVAAWSARLRDSEPVNDLQAAGPLRRICDRTVCDGLLVLGDAAGFVDAVTGEGMSLALLSAELAAPALSGALHCGDVSVASLGRYQRAQRQLTRRLTWTTRALVWALRRPLAAKALFGAFDVHPRVFGALVNRHIQG